MIESKDRLHRAITSLPTLMHRIRQASRRFPSTGWHGKDILKLRPHQRKWRVTKASEITGYPKYTVGIVMWRCGCRGSCIASPDVAV